MLVTICLVIVFISLVLVHVSMRYHKAGRMIDKIPGPTPIPFFGNALMLNDSSEKVWNKILDLLDQYYPLVRMWIGGVGTIFIRHPDDMRALLSCKKNITKSKIVYDGLRSIKNCGIVVSEGDKWRQRRKIINPAFNPNLLRVYTEIMNEHVERFIEDIKNQDDEILHDIVDTFLKLALGIVCETTMGVDLRTVGAEKGGEFLESFHAITEAAYYRGLRPYIKDWMMKFLSIGRRQERAVKGFRDFTRKLIQERRAYHEKIGYQEFEHIADDVEDITTSTNKRKKLCLLDLLLAAERKNLIEEWGIIEEVETLLVASHESSGITMSYALMLLAENQAAQELARAEVTELLNQTDGVLTVADINKLEYLDRCIKETLRLYPSVPMVGRNTTDNIKQSNYDIPHGTDAIMSFFALHRDPNFWPDPEKFDPDRFLPENIKERHPFAYLPFSAGPRSCIGYKFAMLELKLMVARILHNFYIEPIDIAADVKIEMHVILKPKDPQSIKLIKINRELAE